MAYQRKTTTRARKAVTPAEPKLKANEPTPAPTPEPATPPKPPEPRPVATKDQFITVKPVYGDMFEPFQRIAIKGPTHVKETNWVNDQLSSGTLRKC